MVPNGATHHIWTNKPIKFLIFYFASTNKSLIALDASKADPTYLDWKDEWEIMMEKLTDDCENCLYMMRNMESEETRQAKFFDQNSLDEKKTNVLTAIVGMEYFQYDSDVWKIV